MHTYIKISTLIILCVLCNTSKATIKANPDYQWDMMTLGQFAPHPEWIGDNFVNAWKTLSNHGYTPGAGVIVAVVDTGYTPHPNFINNLQTLNGEAGVYGYQFISECAPAGECLPENNKPINYQKNGLDLGNYIDQDFINLLCPECKIQDSIWHGSFITGIIAGNGYDDNNNSGMAGGAYGAKVIPIRALAKSGYGPRSDTINGMYWAAGLPAFNTDGTPIPLNPNPAQVLNLSFGDLGSCSQADQDDIDKIIAKGVIIVAAAGNNNTDVANFSPANCKGVISVAAKGPTGLAFYSNFGATTIAASGGNDESVAGIYSTIWRSKKRFNLADGSDWATRAGTSYAAPHVSAAVAILISVLKAQNRSYTPEYIANVLQKTARAYDNCSEFGCAAGGALDVDAAVKYILANPSPDSDSDSGTLTGLLTLLGIGAVGTGGICLFNHYR